MQLHPAPQCLSFQSVGYSEMVCLVSDINFRAIWESCYYFVCNQYISEKSRKKYFGHFAFSWFATLCHL